MLPKMRNSFFREGEKKKIKKGKKKRERDSIGIAGQRTTRNEANLSINQTLEIRITISKSRDIRNMATYTTLYVQQ